MSVRTREMNSRSTKTDRRLCGTGDRKFEIDPRLTSHGRTTEIRSRMREIEGRTTEIWTAQGSRSELGLSVVRLRFAIRIFGTMQHGKRLTRIRTKTRCVNSMPTESRSAPLK